MLNNIEDCVVVIKICIPQLDIDKFNDYKLIEFLGMSRIDGYPMFALDKTKSSLRWFKLERILYKKRHDVIYDVLDEYLTHISIISI